MPRWRHSLPDQYAARVPLPLLHDRVTIAEPSEVRPSLSVVIDAEEEFDWAAGFDVRNTSVRAMSAVGAVQRLFDEFGIRPTYVVDYPVAVQPEGFGPIKELVDAGKAEIGAHLHPWVSPPHAEEVCARNSYPGNLGADLEAAKLQVLRERIEAAFGRRPAIYKAGRWGFGANTAAILDAQGFAVDLSVSPPFDYTADGGPDYARFSSRPYWFGARRALLGLPLTGGYVGWLRRLGPRWYRRIDGERCRRARVPGLLARARALDRLALAPEAISLDELCRLTRSQLRDGLRTFTMSFHSPSLQPGCTPYVRTRAELERFYDVLRRYFAFFLGDVGGVSRTPLEVRAHLRQHAVPPVT